MEIVWYTAMSMDGKLATAEHSLDFLDTIGQSGDALTAFPTFYSSVDAIIVSAATLRWLVRGGHGWPHGEKPTWVVSHDAELVASIGATPAPLRRVEGDLAVLVDEIRDSGAKRVWLSGGGDVAGQLLECDAIDTVDMTIAPVAVGAGPALFGSRALALRPFHPESCQVIGGNAVRIVWRRVRS